MDKPELKVDAYVLCYNEMKIAPFAVQYWKRYANKVYLYDNGSTDGTLEYLSQFPDLIELRHFDMDGIDERVYIEVKNNWKQSKGVADFVVVSDFDEFVFSPDLMNELSYMKANDDMGKEANRKIRNLWCRNLLVQQIRKRCAETGIELREINPCYTSFIGNIQHPFEDACSASVEIGRRGAMKYIKNTFFPSMTEEDKDTMGSLFGRDVPCSTDRSWKDVYKSLLEAFGAKEFQRRVRTMNVKCSKFIERPFSYKSCIISYNYNYL